MTEAVTLAPILPEWWAKSHEWPRNLPPRREPGQNLLFLPRAADLIGVARFADEWTGSEMGAVAPTRYLISDPLKSPLKDYSHHEAMLIQNTIRKHDPARVFQTEMRPVEVPPVSMVNPRLARLSEAEPRMVRRIVITHNDALEAFRLMEMEGAALAKSLDEMRARRDFVIDAITEACLRGTVVSTFARMEGGPPEPIDKFDWNAPLSVIRDRFTSCQINLKDRLKSPLPERGVRQTVAWVYLGEDDIIWLRNQVAARYQPALAAIFNEKVELSPAAENGSLRKPLKGEVKDFCQNVANLAKAGEIAGEKVSLAAFVRNMMTVAESQQTFQPNVESLESWLKKPEFRELIEPYVKR